MKKILLIILLCLPFGLISNNGITQNQTKTIQTGKWVQTGKWMETVPSCRYNCVSLWHTLWRYSEPDNYGYYQYCYSFQSNAKWNNGRLANTGMYGTTISIDGMSVSYLNYGIAGTNSDTQLNIYFKIHYSYIKNNSSIRFSTKNTYLN